MADGDMSDFLYPDYAKGLGDPYAMSDMGLAVDRLVAARESGETVVVYGDYDIDGITASGVMIEALEANGITARSYIPDRFEEGYGLNIGALEYLAADGVGLVVTVDCGITSVDEAAWAREHGLDLIITDHHSVPEVLPEAVAVINPKRPGDAYAFKDLAGVGVAFKVACALQARTGMPVAGQEKWWLDLVALGTVCDVVPLVGENRVLAHFGIRVLRQTRRQGVVALAQSAGVRVEEIGSYHLGFVLGPRMNATGRLDHAARSLELVRTGDPRRGAEIAGELEELNRQRRVEQTRIFEAAQEMASLQADSPVMILADESWSHGVVGIVASKLSETFKKPALVGQVLGATIKGSARSVPGFNMVDALRANRDLLLKYGGHYFAAGFTLSAVNLEAFRAGMSRYFMEHAETVRGDSEITVDAGLAGLAGANLEAVGQLAMLEPHGSGNPRPLFELSGIEVESAVGVGATRKHLKFGFRDQEGRRIGGIGFGLAELYADMQPGRRVRALAELNKNEWQGVVSPQLVVRELHDEPV